MNSRLIRMAILASVLIGLPLFAGTAYATSCTNNWLGGACVGSIIYNTGTTLNNNVNASGGVTINNGVTLITAGYSFWIGGNFINSGIIDTGVISGTAGAAGGLSGGGAGGLASNGIYVKRQEENPIKRYYYKIEVVL